MIEKKSASRLYLPNRILSKKFVFVLLVALGIIMIEEVVEITFTLLHYAFEGFELVLEEVIQHTFHVDKSTSQLYVFYILIAMAACLLNWAYRKGPILLRRLKEYVYNVYQQQADQFVDYWMELSLLQKILLVTVYIPFCLYIGSFLFL